MRAQYFERLPPSFVVNGRLHYSRHASLMNDLGLRMNGIALPWTDIRG